MYNETEVIESKPKYMISTFEQTDSAPDWLVMAYKNAQAIERVRKVIADMKSNHQSHAEYIKALEQALDN